MGIPPQTLIMMTHTLKTLAVLSCLVAIGCKARTTPKTPQKPPPTKDTSAPFDADYFKAPSEQLATPAMLMLKALKTPSKPAGTKRLNLAQAPTTTLDHVGLNRCAQGWAIQAFHRLKTTGKMRPLPPIYIPKTEIALKTPISVDGSLHPQRKTITATFDAFSAKHIKGTLTTRSFRAKKETIWTIDAKPINVPAAQGLGFFGCYHTGYYTLKAPGDHTHKAPATGTWERAGMYRMFMPLNDRDRIVIWFRLPEHKRRPNEVFRVNLAEVFKAPKKHEIRVLFERIKQGVPTIDGALPAESGKLQLAFKENKTGGPIELTIRELAFPGAWRKERPTLPKTIDIDALIGFTTDLRGILVPVHAMP